MINISEENADVPDSIVVFFSQLDKPLALFPTQRQHGVFRDICLA